MLNTLFPVGAASLAGRVAGPFGATSDSSLITHPGLKPGATSLPFGEVLNDFLGKVNVAQHDANRMVEALAVGEPVDIHQVMLSLSQASNAMQLTLQVRGKLLEAYQELMRLQL